MPLYKIYAGLRSEIHMFESREHAAAASIELMRMSHITDNSMCGIELIKNDLKMLESHANRLRAQRTSIMEELCATREAIEELENQ